MTPRHRYRIVEEIPLETPRQHSPPSHIQQPGISVLQAGSNIGHLERSQVRPVNTLTNSNVPINPSLIPYPPENTLYPGNVLALPGKVETVKTVD